jgi:DNA-binding PadR family transcriptional regulator
MTRALGEFEMLLLAAVLRLEDEAYGASVLREIEDRTGREPVAGAVYTGLRRLEARGLLRSEVGEPTPERGGRRKRYFRLEMAGAEALASSLESIRSISAGLDDALESLRESGGA